jgi:hypothetical protein
MRLSTYLPMSAVALFFTFFLLPSSVAQTVGQTAVSLTTPLPLEVRSPYFNFWTPPYSPTSDLNSTEYFFTQAVGDNASLIHASLMRRTRFSSVAARL